MQDGACEIGAGEVGAAEITALQLGFAKIAARTVLVCAREECFAVGRRGRRRFLILGYRAPGRDDEHEGRREFDEPSRL